ncbi:MAG TPA: ABC transporter permease subunit [Chloroflexota bacterium]
MRALGGLVARPPGLPLASSGLAVALVAAAGLVAYPLLSLFARAAGGGGEPFQRAFSGPVLLAVLHTLWSSGLATALAVALGAALAIATERSRAWGKSWLRLGVSLPILIPPFISAVSWTQAYGCAGLLDKLLHLSWAGLFGVQGTVALLALQSLPLVYLPLAAAFGSQSTLDLERAARASGAGAVATLRTITLPLARPYLLAGAALAYIVSASDFGVPAVVGLPGRFSTVTTEIYRDMAFATNPTSFATVIVLAAFLVALALVVLLCLRQPVLDAVLSVGAGRRGVPAPGGFELARLLVTLAVLTWIALVSLFPLAAMLLVALVRAYGLPLAAENLTLLHVTQALQGESAAALARSCLLAVAAATAVTCLGVAVALGARRGLLGRSAELVVTLPYAIPGSALAAAVILAFNRWLYGTLAIILLAYVGRFWALGSRPIAAALSQLGPDPVRAAQVCGARAWRSFLTGAWPALQPAAAAAWLLVFLTAIHELTVSSLLYTPATQTVAVVVLNAEQGGDVARTAAISVLLTGIVLVVAVPAVGLRARVGRSV